MQFATVIAATLLADVVGVIVWLRAVRSPAYRLRRAARGQAREVVIQSPDGTARRFVITPEQAARLSAELDGHEIVAGRPGVSTPQDDLVKQLA